MIVEDKDVEYTGAKGVPHAVFKEGMGEKHKTGEWRMFKPVMQHAACAACNLCWVVCPDSAISLNHQDKPVVNYEVCKGCLICWQTCPKEGAIKKERDTHLEE